MRIFIDACVDPRVADLFEDHEVSTAVDLGWHELGDNEIVARCNGRFDVLLTADRGFEHNLAKLHFGIIILHVSKNKIDFYRPLREDMLDALDGIAEGRVIHVR